MLPSKLKQELKAKAHSLKPIVFIGVNGLTDNVIKEIDRGLTDHEIIKIRIHSNDRDEKQALFASACEATSAHPVQLIGKIGVMYRKNPE
ncbi:MAG TPA: ribosome assembly RNA-binding protein YhbY [Gammaproteobacteria bacterium]|jgi:RNA-binding protein|nr:ribosome assembly RNA-binding protein YhbY [Gammaproteobacteria bacterium]